jgi:hypothetical protein
LWQEPLVIKQIRPFNDFTVLVQSQVWNLNQIVFIKKAFSGAFVEELEGLIMLYLARQSWNGRELIIEDNVELRRDMLGGWVEDKRHIGGVLRGEAYKDSLSYFAVPFRDLSTIL